MDKINLSSQKAIPVGQLPGLLKKIADPDIPLTKEEKAVYEPPAHAELNMIRIGLWFALGIGTVGFLFALTSVHSRAFVFLLTMVLCGIGILLVQGRYIKHRKYGGDLSRLGVYILREGILVIAKTKEGRKASFLRREDVCGFLPEEGAKEYSDAKIRIATETGIWSEYAFPSVGMLSSWHLDCLNRWKGEGVFSWKEYKNPRNSAKET